MYFRELIRSAHPYLDCFDAENYPKCFEEFEAAAAEVFQTELSAEEALNDLAQEYGRWFQREQRELAFCDKRVLALFLTPAALRAGKEDFAQQLCKLWNAKFPRNPYLVGSYETIMKGFEVNFLGISPFGPGSRRRFL